MSEELLEIKDLHVIYKTSDEVVYAVNGVSFSIGKGETLGLVGETGAGKTTIAHSILRVLADRVGKVTGGEIFFNGQDLLKLNSKDMRAVRGAKISMIFQDPMTSLNPIRTVGDQIAEVLRLHKEEMSKEQIEEKVGDILEMVGIPRERKNEYPHQFSGGMKQRIVIAIALACEPQLLLADEPTTALDVTIQAQILQLMKGLKERLNTSMMLITHDLGVVAQTCDKVAVIYAGEIIEMGTAEDLFRGDKHHPYTVGLFGSLPDLTQKRARLNPIPGLMPDPTDLPTGCKFHTRCKHCTEQCKNEVPPVVENGTHMLRCHLFGDTAVKEEQIDG